MKSPIAQKTVLATFPSKSSPGTVHTVSLGADGVVYCSCRGWRMCHNHPSNRVCCHTREVVARMSLGGRSLVAAGPEPVMVRPSHKRASKKPARTFWERI